LVVVVVGKFVLVVRVVEIGKVEVVGKVVVFD